MPTESGFQTLVRFHVGISLVFQENMQLNKIKILLSNKPVYKNYM